MVVRSKYLNRERAAGVVFTAWNCLAAASEPGYAELKSDQIPDDKRVLLVAHGGYLSCAYGKKLEVNGQNITGTVEISRLGVAKGAQSLDLQDLTGTVSTDGLEREEAEQSLVLGSFTHNIAAADCKETEAGLSPCANKRRPWLKKSVKEALEESGYKVDWLVSCYASDPDVVFFVDSDSPEQQLKTDRTKMWSRLKSMAEKVGKIMVVGHSYGGWTAMKTVMQLDRNVDELMTLDPISVEHCKPNHYLSGSKDCMRFPRDIDGTVQNQVDRLAQIWRHYWQELTKPSGWSLGLHSGALELGESQVFQARLEVNHSEIHDRADVWENFVQAFDEDVSILR